LHVDLIDITITITITIIIKRGIRRICEFLLYWMDFSKYEYGQFGRLKACCARCGVIWVNVREVNHGNFGFLWLN